MATKTCFIISPIGTEGSEPRKNADDLMDLVIQPALEKYRFTVVRADKIPRPSMITSDIVELVQNAELCVIDLTGYNPNVFYECGRRHETGKPFIQLQSKGENLPFDVSGIRTVSYDLSSPRSVLESIKAIQGYVDEFEKTGYTTTSSGASLSTVAAAVGRIERTVRTGDIDRAAAVLKRMRNIEPGEFSSIKISRGGFSRSANPPRASLSGRAIPAVEPPEVMTSDKNRLSCSISCRRPNTVQVNMPKRLRSL
jgi:hypothetical protein